MSQRLQNNGMNPLLASSALLLLPFTTLILSLGTSNQAHPRQHARTRKCQPKRWLRLT